MPSHIDYRLGMYREALQSNVEAVAVDETCFASSPRVRRSPGVALLRAGQSRMRR